jgi:hypothetical protein
MSYLSNKLRRNGNIFTIPVISEIITHTQVYEKFNYFLIRRFEGGFKKETLAVLYLRSRYRARI